MRVSALRKLRSMDMAQIESVPYTITAPVGGLNAREAWAEMPETDAITLDNWFPQTSWVEIRNGYTTLGTFSGYCATLCAYNALTGSNQLYAAVNNSGTYSIYRVDNLAGGAVGSPVVGGGGSTVEALTSAVFDWAQFGTGSAEVLYMVNGTDNPLLFDGTTWYALTSVSAPYALTGGPSPLSSLSQVVRYKSRLWFVQANTFNVYYLAQNVFAGALTQLNLAPNFNLGGYLKTVVTVSIDNAAGLNDFIAFISNQGEVVTFQGYDPSSVSTWSEAAHFKIGRPLASGRRAWQKVGSDAFIATVDGLVPYSKSMVTDRSQEQIAITDKIRNSFNQDAQVYGTYQGWQVQLHPAGTKLLVNVPTVVNAASYQYVQNTLSGAWCSFNKYSSSSWNALCFEEMGDGLFFGSVGFVAQCDTSATDGGGAILCTALPAFSAWGARGVWKMPTAVQPIFSANATVTLGIVMNYDFTTTAGLPAVTVTAGPTTPWGASWGALWGSTLFQQKPWIGVSGAGYAASMTMRVSGNGLLMQWQLTNLLYKGGSPLYG